MSTGSSIEWTDATGLSVESAISQRESTDEGFVQLLTALRKPLDNILISFTAVARQATWDHVPWSGLSAFAYRHDVIPCVGWIFAVCAVSAKIFHQKISRFKRHGVNPTPPPSGVIICAKSEVRAVCVSFSPRCIFAVSTLAATNQIRIKPLQAITTPRTPEPRHKNSFRLGGTGGDTVLPTQFTTRVETIAPRSINAKRPARLPSVTLVAEFLTAIQLRHVVIERQSDPLRCDFQDSNSASHKETF